LLGEDGSLADYAWSSFPQYLKPSPQWSARLMADRLLGKWGIRNDNAPEVGGTENRVGCGIEKTDGAVYGVDRELNAGPRRVFGMR